MKNVFIIRRERIKINASNTKCYTSENVNDVMYDDEQTAIKALREMCRDLHCTMQTDEEGFRLGCCWAQYFVHNGERYHVVSTIDITEEEYLSLDDTTREWVDFNM